MAGARKGRQGGSSFGPRLSTAWVAPVAPARREHGRAMIEEAQRGTYVRSPSGGARGAATVRCRRGSCGSTAIATMAAWSLGGGARTPIGTAVSAGSCPAVAALMAHQGQAGLFWSGAGKIGRAHV